MIHTLRQSPKFVRLLRMLRPLANGEVVDAETIAVGLLERLWHATITGAMRGDIGRYDNEVIAEMCGWTGDADLLVRSLVETGFLDECKEHRLVVHDWCEHAPKHVKGNVTKLGGFIKAEPLRPGLKGEAPKAPPLGMGPPNLTNSNQTQPNQTKPKSSAAKPPVPDLFKSFWDAYPKNITGRKRGHKTCLEMWSKFSDEDQVLLVSAATNYANETKDAKYVRDPERFLKKDWWRDFVEPSEAKPESRIATTDDMASYNPNARDEQ